MNFVFLLQHVHVFSEDNQDVKIIGIYENEQDALDAIGRLAGQPGFCDYPEIVDPSQEYEPSGFHISKYKVGQDNWIEGYETI